MADYVYQEYPRILYKGSETKHVHDDDEKKAALKAGFSLTQDAPADVEPVADADVEAVEDDAPKKKPGRPKKAE